MKTKLLMVPVISLVTGCMNIGSKFDCNVGSGGKCAPMHQINKMVNSGGIKSEIPVIPTFTYKKSTKDNYLTSARVPTRSNEQIQQIWIGPYEDASGNYHEQSYVYTVVKKSSWLVQHNLNPNGVKNDKS